MLELVVFCNILRPTLGLTCLQSPISRICALHTRAISCNPNLAVFEHLPTLHLTIVSLTYISDCSYVCLTEVWEEQSTYGALLFCLLGRGLWLVQKRGTPVRNSPQSAGFPQGSPYLVIFWQVCTIEFILGLRTRISQYHKYSNKSPSKSLYSLNVV